MAIFHMQINTVSRSGGRNAPASAAYRAGERIRNERTGVLYDHRSRQDVLHKEIVLPARLAGAAEALAWARDRASLWNAAERIEHRADSRVAREYMVALPAELPAAQRLELARSFSREIAERYNVAVDLAVHAPRPEGDPRNFHAHLLATTREVRSEGLGPKTGLDMKGTTRAELGLPTARREFAALRARWAELVNERLRAAHLEVHIDARSLAAQGIEREPQARLPWGALRAERRGERSEIAERVRARYRSRVAARAASIDRGAGAARPREQADAAPDPAVASASEQRRREAVRDWLAYREAQAHRVADRSQRNVPVDAERARQEAVEAWRNRQAKEGERRERVGGREGGREAGPSEDGPAARSGRSRDFSL
jgi:ATP-dependent exoDNAse (exonuclease V) alpha subunit